MKSAVGSLSGQWAVSVGSIKILESWQLVKGHCGLYPLFKGNRNAWDFKNCWLIKRDINSH